jgi:predicted regulator of Ras-like GTPase activity (Roadblock/LC7/MglB family)
MTATGTGPMQLRAWSEEVARDPGSLAFLPLAAAYMAADRTAAAIRLCVRGLEHHPSHVEAHVLLGKLYRVIGDLDRAHDEWDIALHLDPDHRGARREVALLCAERREWKSARRHLERALAGGAPDPELAEVLARVREHVEQGTRSRISAPVSSSDAMRALVKGLDGPIGRFVRAARPEVVLLINSHGKLLGQHGFPRSMDPVAIASLGAGIHASSRAMAQLMEQDGFHHMYQKGARGHLFLGPFVTPGEELILIAVLSDDSLLGLVRVAFAGFVREVAELPEWSVPRVAATAESFESDLESGYAHVFGRAGVR